MGNSIAFIKVIRCFAIFSALGILLAGCGATLPKQEETDRHLSPEESEIAADIPSTVEQAPSEDLSNIQKTQTPDLYSVVAQDLPVRELLFTIARDAGLNIDIHPNVTGRVSLNAIDQTLPQILNRVSSQTEMRWSFDYNGNLLIEHDAPYWDTYRINYLNVDRDSSTSAELSTSISSGAGGANTSTVTISQTSSNNFWGVLTENLEELAAVTIETIVVDEDGNESVELTTTSDVIVNPETGVIAVKAADKKHEEISSFLNFVEARALQQVLIEATVVEVELNDQYQAGVDWQKLSQNGEGFVQSLTAGNLGGAPNNIFTIDNGSDVSATVSMLSQFGNSKILSSPKIMALNNQAAMLRVVDNRVYFTIEVEPGTTTDGGVRTDATFSTEVNTVPVGFSMTVTPQVSENDQVTLNVRPTISRILRFVNDPNPELARENIVNPIPEIQVREMESVLKVYSGETAVLGGLMQDTLQTSTDGIPAVSRLPVVGNLFSYRDDTASKTELIIFIRPLVIREPSLNADFKKFNQFLPSNGASNLKSSRDLNSDFWGR